MVKSISSSLLAHLAQPVNTLAACWLIERTDGVQFAYTSLDRDVVVNGIRYQSRDGFSRSAIVTGSQGSVDNLEVLGFFSDDGITEKDLINGLFNYASIWLFLVNWADLTQGILRLRRGWLGETSRQSNGGFHVELRGLSQALTQEFSNVFTPGCRADLGDNKCKVPIAPAPWQPNTPYKLGDWVSPLNKSTDALKTAIFKVTTAGTSGAAEPAWDLSAAIPFVPLPVPTPTTPTPPTTITTTVIYANVPIGGYFGNVSDPASGSYPGFNAEWDGFVAAMGRTPTIVTSFMDQTHAPDDATYNWTAQASYLCGLLRNNTRTASATPAVSWPFGWNNAGTAVPLFTAISNGSLDSLIQAALGAWKAGGVTKMYVRPAWEFNIPGNYAVDATNLAAFIAAWQHFYGVVKAYAASNGMQIKVIWCPNVGTNQVAGGTALTVAQQYPGDGYVDVLGIDTYGAPIDTLHAPGTTTTDTTQYLVTTMINMGVSSNKPIAFCEVGGIDVTFANAMVTTLINRLPTSTIEYFGFWDIDDTSGTLSWTNTSDSQASLIAAWKAGFGAQGKVSNATVTTVVIPTPGPGARTPYPAYDHVVVVILENHSYSDIVGDTTDAPYINSLLSSAAVFTNFTGVTHPSEPNYFALYGGDTFGVTDDGTYSEADPSLYTALAAKGKSFTGWIEPASPQKHNPWESFPEGAAVEKSFATWPTDFTLLPSVSFVIPDLTDDMHDGTILQGDNWLRANMDGYIQWAKTHNSLFILTFDEDDFTSTNRVLTLLAGDHLVPGTYSPALNHYSTLGTILTMFGAALIRQTASAALYPTTIFAKPALPPPPTGSGKPRVVAPLTITVTPGSWTGAQLTTGPVLPSGQRMKYAVLLPAGYSTAVVYPAMFWLHENMEGNEAYDGSGSAVNVATNDGPDGWFNTVWFRTNCPAIIVVPCCDQTTDTTGGATYNFGGWNPPNDDANEDSVAAIAQHVIATYSADPTRMYVTGASLGGIGTWAQMLDYNALNGTRGQIWAAGAPFAGVIERYNGAGPDTALLASMANVPVFAVHGSSDGESQPFWDRAFWQGYAGNANYPSAPGSMAGSSAFHYLEDPGLGHDVWDTYTPNGPGNPIYTWMFSQVATIAGTTVPTPTPTPPPPGPPGSNFRVSGGQILTPAGTVFVGGGINISDYEMGSASTNSSNTPLTTLFPNIKIVRVACYDLSQPASYYQAFVDNMTAAGIVVLLEDHTSSDGSNYGGATGVVFTGTLLTNELNWYARLAAAFKANPYVWFGTNNEPSYDPSIDALCTWHQQTYNAIRGAGAPNMVLIDLPGGGNPGTYGSGAMNASIYAGMTNIAWDFHQYAWAFSSGGSDGQNGPSVIAQSVIQSQQIANIATAQTITSADGTIPVVAGEFGPSTTGSSNDVSGTELVGATMANTTGASGHFSAFMAWHWGMIDSYNDLTTSSAGGSLTSYGSQVAAGIP